MILNDSYVITKKSNKIDIKIHLKNNKEFIITLKKNDLKNINNGIDILGILKEE